MGFLGNLTKGLVFTTWNIFAALVGLFFLPLGYLLIGKPIRGVVVTALMILVVVFTGGIGLILFPLPLIDIASGGKMG